MVSFRFLLFVKPIGKHPDHQSLYTETVATLKTDGLIWRHVVLVLLWEVGCFQSLCYPWKTESVLPRSLHLCCKFLTIILTKRMHVVRIYHHWFRLVLHRKQFLNNGVISFMDVHMLKKNFSCLSLTVMKPYRSHYTHGKTEMLKIHLVLTFLLFGE